MRRKSAHLRRGSPFPPRQPGHADTVFAGDHASRQHLLKKIVQRRVTSPDLFRVGLVHHQVDVNVLVSRMAETGHADTVFCS